MKPEQREALRQEVIRWTQSKSFDGYFAALHLTPRNLGLAFLACVLTLGRIGPADVIRGARRRGLATSALRRRYRRLAETGQVVLADTWMANSALTSREVDCAPALLIAASGGTTKTDNYVQHVAQRLLVVSCRQPATPEEREIQALLEDEEFHAFRVRTLPLSFTESSPVHLFDTMLHSSAVADGDVRQMPFVVCIAHPQLRPGILPIPISIASRYVGT